MPELPEVETTLQGIKPYLEQQRITDVIIRHYGLRWPIPKNIRQKLLGSTIQKLERRAKYLLLTVEQGAAIIHLGMSGRLRILQDELKPGLHDHFDIKFANNLILRFTDPRRFGAFLWTDKDPFLHPRLKNLGLEPFDKRCVGNYLWDKSRHKKMPIKTFIMTQRIIVGVGNIYANEALFVAGIHPAMPAQAISLRQYNVLMRAIRYILKRAIEQGGTTLKDFLNSAGKPGYFANQLQVYDRAGQPCVKCQLLLKLIRIGQRSTVFCEQCQPDSVS